MREKRDESLWAEAGRRAQMGLTCASNSESRFARLIGEG